jgi:hypothetical protein
LIIWKYSECIPSYGAESSYAPTENKYRILLIDNLCAVLVGAHKDIVLCQIFGPDAYLLGATNVFGADIGVYIFVVP